MLRFIIKHDEKDPCNECEWHVYNTIDCNVPELEKILRDCGFGEVGYRMNTLMGAQVLDDDKSIPKNEDDNFINF